MADQMRQLGFDEVRIDEVGNVLGRLGGRGEAPAMMFNTHLDHVDVGDPAAWPYPPFGAEIHDERVWGRGAVDIKGPLAAQVFGVARLVGAETPAGDVWVTAVVQEEIGGIGARHLASTMETPLVVVGEPSRNTVRRGHRGRTELVVHLQGRSVHASVPERGVNPLYALGRFLIGMENLAMPSDPELGASTVAPTLLRTDQTSANVVPGQIWQTCDWRNIPGQSGAQAQAVLQEIGDRIRRHYPECAEVQIEVRLPVVARRTWTGLERPIAGANPAYLLPAEHPAVMAAAAICEEALGERRSTGIWQFATDGGHFAAAGMTPVGFGPGNELLAHTVDEHIEVAALEEAMRANAALARRLAAEVG